MRFCITLYFHVFDGPASVLRKVVQSSNHSCRFLDQQKGLKFRATACMFSLEPCPVFCCCFWTLVGLYFLCIFYLGDKLGLRKFSFLQMHTGVEDTADPGTLPDFTLKCRGGREEGIQIVLRTGTHGEALLLWCPTPLATAACDAPSPPSPVPPGA